MTNYIRSIAVIALLLIPSFATAMPGNITDLEAKNVNGEIVVSWKAPVIGDAVAYYRIYVSEQSILDSNGEYNTFERTTGAETTYTLKQIPLAPKIYISVLGVDQKGMESGFFSEEVGVLLNEPTPLPTVSSSSSIRSSSRSSLSSVALTEKSSSSSVQIPVTEPETTMIGGTMLELLSAKALTQTGVLLTFSSPVRVSETQAADAFTIKDSSGTILPITRLVIRGQEVILVTDVQTRNRIYEVRATSVVSGQNAQGSILPLDTTKALILFAGHPMGKVGSTGSATAVPSEVSNLRLQAQETGTNRYSVIASWTASPSKDVMYVIRQTLDRGKTWSAEQRLPGTATSVRIQNVPSGEFGVIVQAANKSGGVSKGITSNITLPKTGNADDLSDTGAGAALCVAFAGAIVGWRKMRLMAN